MNHRLAVMRNGDPEDRGRGKWVSEACFLEDGLAVLREPALLIQGLRLVSDREKERKNEFKAICPFGLTSRKTAGGTFTEGIVRAKPPDVTAVSILGSDSPDEERAAKRLT